MKKLEKLEKLAVIFASITIVLLIIGTISLLMGYIDGFWHTDIILPSIILGLISLGMTIAFIVMLEDK